MKCLLVVDLQREFVNDSKGEEVYDNCLTYIKSNRNYYDCVVAVIYKNDMSENENMVRLLNWDKCKEIASLDFSPDKIYYHAGYSIKNYQDISKEDTVDIIGFDTDACILSACFDIFNLGCNMNILTDLCWSSGGSEYHNKAISIMKRQFGKAIK